MWQGNSVLMPGFSQTYWEHLWWGEFSSPWRWNTMGGALPRPLWAGTTGTAKGALWKCWKNKKLVFSSTWSAKLQKEHLSPLWTCPLFPVGNLVKGKITANVASEPRLLNHLAEARLHQAVGWPWQGAAGWTHRRPRLCRQQASVAPAMCTPLGLRISRAETQEALPRSKF